MPISKSKHAGVNKPCNCGVVGWMPGIEHVPVKWALPSWIAEREGKMRPIAVVDHIMQGFLNTIVAWASNGESKIIVHFGIDRNGRIVQFHPVDTPARHVSAINSPLSKLVKARGQDAGTTGANGYTIGIEHEGCSVPLTSNDGATIRAVTWTPHNPWPLPMVASSIRVKKWCFENVPSLGKPSRDTVIGHYEIDARNRPEDPAPSKWRYVWPSDKMISFETSTPTPPVEKEEEMSNVYLVQKKDTLWGISQRFKKTVNELKELNKLSGDTIYEGTLLYLEKVETPLKSQETDVSNFARAVYEEQIRWTNDSLARIGNVESAMAPLKDGLNNAKAELQRRIADIK